MRVAPQFTWTVAEACAAEGFWPDVISTDIHSGNIEGPCYDLPTTSEGLPLPLCTLSLSLSPPRLRGRLTRVYAAQ